MALEPFNHFLQVGKSFESQEFEIKDLLFVRLCVF